MRSILTGLVALAAFMGSASAASAEQWRAVAETESYPLTVMYVDQSSLNRQGQIVTGWVMTVMEDAVGEDAAKRDWSHSVIYRKVDCVGNTTQMLRSKYYNHTAMIEDNTAPTKVRDIQKGSMFEGVADVMCGRADYTSQVIGDPVKRSFEYFATK